MASENTSTGNGDPGPERIVEWLLKNAFDEEESEWPKLHDVLHRSLRAARERFPDALGEIESHVDTLPADAPEEETTDAIRPALGYLVYSARLDQIEAEGKSLSEAEEAGLFDLTMQPLPLEEQLQAVRAAVGAERPGEKDKFAEQMIRRLLHALGRDEGQAVHRSGGVNLSRFAFDKSNLPEEFQKKKFRKLYRHTVRQSLGNLGNATSSYVAATIGMLLIEGHHDPAARDFYHSVQRFYTELSTGADPENVEKVKGTDVYLPDGSRHITVFEAAYEVIEDGLARGEKIYFQDFARAGRKIASNYARRPPKSPGFPAMVRAVYDEATRGSAGGGQGGGGGIGRISLPPLTEPGAGSDTIRPDNIRAIATIYAAFQLERTLLFQCTDRVVDLWSAGLLSTSYSEALRPLDAYRWNAEDRLTEAARWAQYSRALGAQGGASGPVEVNANTEFNSLLLRFISIVADFQNTLEIGNIVTGAASSSRGLLSSGEGCRKAGYDLAANMSLYGWAGTYFTAERLTRHIQDAIAILDLQEVRDAFGVATWTQVLERVAVREFGVSINVAKHLTLAEETRQILNLIAEKSGVWGLSGNRPLFTLDSPSKGKKMDGDLGYEETLSLFRSMQYWVAVNAVGPETIDEFRRHAEPAPAPSLPMIGALPSMDANVTTPAAGGGDQLKQMLMEGQMPSMDQLKSMVGL